MQVIERSFIMGLLERVDRKSTRLNSSHGYISYAVFCLKKNNVESRDRERTSNPPARGTLGVSGEKISRCHNHLIPLSTLSGILVMHTTVTHSTRDPDRV